MYTVLCHVSFVLIQSINIIGFLFLGALSASCRVPRDSRIQKQQVKLLSVVWEIFRSLNWIIIEQNCSWSIAWLGEKKKNLHIYLKNNITFIFCNIEPPSCSDSSYFQMWLLFGHCNTTACSRTQFMIRNQCTRPSLWKEWSLLLCYSWEPSQMFGSNTQFSVVGRGNWFLELRSVGVLWQENQRNEEEQWKDWGECVFCCERNLPLKSINLGGVCHLIRRNLVIMVLLIRTCLLSWVSIDRYLCLVMLLCVYHKQFIAHYCLCILWSLWLKCKSTFIKAIYKISVS